MRIAMMFQLGKHAVILELSRNTHISFLVYILNEAQFAGNFTGPTITSHAVLKRRF